jgi:hypothetical protein
MVPAESFLSLASQWINSKVVFSDSGSFLAFFLTIWNLENILSAVE